VTRAPFPIPPALINVGTREDVEAWVTKQLGCLPQSLAFEMDEDTDVINIWGPTEPDWHCPLVATIDLFTNHVRIAS
jgi:hypothetical protein